MLYIQRKYFFRLIRKRLYSSEVSVTNRKKGKTFQKTVFLPKTEFLAYLKPEEVHDRDQRILKDCRFLDFYAWQKEHRKGKHFVLHDGPPYANGKPHIGHAINKIYKDIILRSQAIQGCKVHFMPGWDCHGLPIELVATGNAKNPLKPIEIRQLARDLALKMAKLQKDAFIDWGIMGDWENECYYTCSTKYIVNQLKIFWKMYERGLIFYDLKPVYWSPSSQTALAEAELLYKDCTTKAVTVRFSIVNESSSEPFFLLIWTTTPWTLPLNSAVYFSPQMSYSVIKIKSFMGLYIIAKDLIENFQKKLKLEVSIVSDISNDELRKLVYKHPWKQNETMRVYESPNVKLSGTGLLHSVPGHGHEDFLMGLANDLKVECFVDERGCYMPNAGNKLSGLYVLEEGSETVIKHMASEIVLIEDYNHSYPYDWRTDKPVIIRTSNQWFIDTDELKEKAIENLKDVKVPLQYFQDRLKCRPYWCLSRQRTWGVPIPAFFHKTSKRPLLSRDLINHLCCMIESSGPDIWWTAKVEDLFPDKVCRELFVQKEDIVKGKDIMDIWFDSGISWSYALEGKTSDIYLEGIDQYGGWFQSSLLTSVAVGNGAPFKRILTHGFAVDENGKKMSKSLGNVVDPETVIKGSNAFGVDTLRWWVSSHSQNYSVPVSNALLKLDFESLQKIRKILRYLLGALSNASEEELSNTKNSFLTLDIFILNSCFKFYRSVIDSYNSYNLRSVTAQILHFVSNEISARYITAIKDRLYCDDSASSRRRACRFVLNEIFNTLTHALAPIVPHLAEEAFMHHPIYKGKQKSIFFYNHPWNPSEWWSNDSADESIKLLDEIKQQVLAESDTIKMSCLIEIERDGYDLLKEMQNGKEESFDSELTDILTVAEVRLKVSDRKKIILSPTNATRCARCRRYTVFDDNDLCCRCKEVLSKDGITL